MANEQANARKLSSTETRNLFGIKTPPTGPWLGQVAEAEDGTAIFSNSIFSIRAWLMDAQTVLFHHEHTLASFISRSHPSGTPPDAAAQDIEARSWAAFSATQGPLPLPTAAPELWFAIARVWSQQETGRTMDLLTLTAGFAIFALLPFSIPGA